MMFNFLNKRTTVLYLFFILVSPLMILVTGSFLSVMLGINVLFAYVSLSMIWLLRKLFNKDRLKITIVQLIVFLVYLFLLPNTFYILTDLIHINSSEFYTFEELYSPQTYFDNIVPYLMAMHIFLATLFGVYAGVESLRIFQTLLKDIKIKKIYQDGLFYGVIFLSSIGIYIGRFIRYFSWDIFNPIKIVVDLIDRFNWFMVMFIILFFGLQTLLYHLYKLIKR